MIKNTISFVGLSKNCFETLKNNIENLMKLNDLLDGNCKIIIVDSDSKDGTKEYFRNYQKKNRNFLFIEEDNLDYKFQNRIQKLTYCRNVGLNAINKKNSIIYIPMDMDIDLFSIFDILDFHKLVLNFSEDAEIEGMFPISIPYYYDIFALRKVGWVKNNAVLEAHKLKQKFKIGSFFFNYYFVFRKQNSSKYFTNKLTKVDSAFGGIGMYKLQKGVDYKYSVNETNSNFYSEHISFNYFFKNLFINNGWKIEAPLEHIYFKNSSFLQKILYFFKTFKYDFLNLLNRKKI